MKSRYGPDGSTAPLAQQHGGVVVGALAGYFTRWTPATTGVLALLIQHRSEHLGLQDLHFGTGSDHLVDGRAVGCVDRAIGQGYAARVPARLAHGAGRDRGQFLGAAGNGDGVDATVSDGDHAA